MGNPITGASKLNRARNVSQGKLEDMKNAKLATGATSAKTTKAGDKTLSMAAYRSMSDKERASEKLLASQMERAGQITTAERKAIHKKIDDANALEKTMADAKKSGKKKPVSLSQMEKNMPDAGMRKGGMPFNKGGMPSRKGNFDMRKGGMFAK